MGQVLIGAIGDDVTGSTDLALMLSKHGMSVVQYDRSAADPVRSCTTPRRRWWR